MVMEVIWHFLVGLVFIASLTYLPWLLGDSICKDDDANLDVKDKWLIGMGIILFTTFSCVIIYYIGEGVMYFMK